MNDDIADEERLVVDNYFYAHAALCEHFGYTDDWRVFPFADKRSYYWACDGDTIYYADSEDELARQKGAYYESPICTYRYLSKYVYEAGDLTMIIEDTQTDGNIFLSIFSNERRREVPADE